MDGQRDVYQRQIRNAFTLDVFAVVSSDSKAADFTPNDARLILHRVASRGSHLQANRVRSYLMAAFARAIEHDMNPLHMKSSTLFGVQMNPIRDIPRIVKREPVGDRALSADEVRDLWRLLLSGRHFDASTALVLRLAICTGQRINEVADIERADYDLDRALWSLPATKTKNRKPHLVPMHPLAVEALALAETLTPTGSQLFPNRDHPDQPIRLDSISKAVARFCKSDGWTHDPFTPRDLRRTWKTLTGELGLSKEIRDRIQNHALNDVASKHYDLWSYLPEKVTAMTAWGERLHRIVEGTSGALSQNVIAIRR
ncbi:MAG: site-specific integrase [Thiotrichales bacterium]